MAPGLVTWSESSINDWSPNLSGSLTTVVMSADGTNVVANTGKVTYTSHDYGYTFAKSVMGDAVIEDYSGLACDATCEHCYTLDSDGYLLKTSSNYAQSFTPVDISLISKQNSQSLTPPSLVKMSQDGVNIVALGRFFIASSNSGTTFSTIVTPSTFAIQFSFSALNSFISMDRSDRLYFNYVQTASGNYISKLFKSLDFGATWTDMTPYGQDDDTAYFQVAFDLSGVHGLAMTVPYNNARSENILISTTDSGVTWQSHSSTLFGGGKAQSFCQDHATGQFVTVGGYNSNQLWASTDFGVTFVDNDASYTSSGDAYAMACSYDGSHLFISSNDDKNFLGFRVLPTSRRLETSVHQASELVAAVPSFKPTFKPTFESRSAGDKSTPVFKSTATVGFKPTVSSILSADEKTSADSPSKSAAANTVESTSNKCIERVNQFACVGRGYPDLAVLGHNYQMVSGGKTVAVSGTAASASVVSGMISLVNARRLKAGKSTLGWLNPALYQYSHLFVNDITSAVENNDAAGDNKMCDNIGSGGFKVGPGWDAVTGLGSVNFTAFSDTLFALGYN